jgi:ABC-type lipoprotein export system ATPase subunit
VIIATHDPSAAALGQRTIELRHGRVSDPGVVGPAPDRGRRS